MQEEVKEEAPVVTVNRGGFGAFESSSEEEEEEEEEEKVPVIVKTNNGGFGGFESSSEEEEEEDEEVKEEEKERPAEKKVEITEEEDISAQLATLSLSDLKKKKSKKGKKSSSKKDEKETEEEKKERRAKKKAKKEKERQGEETKETSSKPKKEKKAKTKLSNKERRALKDLEEREASNAKLASQRAAISTDFAVSCTSVNQKDEKWINATDIIIPQFSINAYKKPLFEDAELRIIQGRRYGLIGPNGMGKTTVMKMIAESPDLPIPPKIDLIYVEQEVTADDTPAVEMVLRADKRRTYLIDREKILMELSEPTDEEHEELIEVAEEMRAIGADGAEAKALSLLRGLGFTPDMLRAPTKSFSGGWRMRVSIARALFMECELTLLDEPTNHLDLAAVIFLEDYLQRLKKTLIVVSHDQGFLDTVCTDIIHLNNKKLDYYRGNFESFHR